MNQILKDYTRRLEDLGTHLGLDYYPVDFEVVPPSFMMEVAVYGLPVRMPHWSFGVRYIYQFVQHRMGNSHLFEVVFPGNPGRAFMAETNNLAENTLVTAHVLGHADFSKNNALFRRGQEEVGYHIVEQAAAHAHQITEALEEHGQRAVERVLDAALALEQHIDPHAGLRRPRYPVYESPASAPPSDDFLDRFRNLPGQPDNLAPRQDRRRAPLPPHPEKDLLWFIAEYAPQMEDWERDIFHAVRQESFYFQPVYSCQIMNEGWACLWHTTLLREADFLPQDLFLDAMKTHSDVVRPYAGEQQVALAINPYHVGFVMWSHIVRDHGFEAARRIMEQEDDFGFVRNHLSDELIKEMDLFHYHQRQDGEIRVSEQDNDALRESLVADKFNFGAPHIEASEVRSDGTLVLRHNHAIDGRGLDLNRSDKVLEYVNRVWRRPVMLYTINDRDEEVIRLAG
ncbi:MAG: SpoVR family protein [Chromatiales bacterium]|nr:SpoVR family protein [Chromatiales bacterium]